MNKKLTRTRLILAISSSILEETTIFVLGRWVLPEFGVHLPLAVLVAVMIAWACFSVWLFLFTSRTLKKQAQVGLPSMIGMRGKAVGDLTPEGMVKIRSELWGAVVEEGDIEAGVEVEVVSQDNLKLIVRKTGVGIKH